MAAEVDLRMRFKPISGIQDQAAGLAWRCGARQKSSEKWIWLVFGRDVSSWLDTRRLRFEPREGGLALGFARTEPPLGFIRSLL
jgi:hypothetical protein